MGWAQITPSPALLVLAKQDRTLAIVDPTTLKVVARLPSGPEPHEVIASPDGRTAYISNYGTNNTLTRDDLVAQKPLPVLDLGVLHSPHGLWFAGGELYFTAEANKVFGRFDPATQKIDWIMGTGQDRTHMVVVNPTLDRIFTSNVASATISIFDKVTRQAGPPASNPHAPRVMRTDWEETVIPVGRGSEGFDITPDWKQLWVGNAGDGTISVIDIPSKKVIDTLQANVPGANRLKFTLDGKRAFISSLTGAGVAVFDVATREEIKRFNLGHGAAGILMQPGGSRVYVSCSPDNYVAVIDLATLEVVGRIDAGRNPDGLAWVTRP